MESVRGFQRSEKGNENRMTGSELLRGSFAGWYNPILLYHKPFQDRRGGFVQDNPPQEEPVQRLSQWQAVWTFLLSCRIPNSFWGRQISCNNRTLSMGQRRCLRGLPVTV